ncbi:hypothetical protein [Bradyrhizobium diazoefficiens]|uniref:hypothetical protein n=1 Tax=Bradyrhizobium diazoefficiens TaxID=1355477 RepID=UPI0027154D15|nr:hypothetical protein [Bradyrhizobium diazoefficiens]WLB34897.1 hypothetical protein QIH78_25785 [Bradyrhizobium diazoefficiens]BCF44631.1 hypothetical protein XF16B_51210 [Bradyrhizobium diazoefficiens]BCF70777.1 hypothetical protein XF19B_51300 [Bradyrhizobium diazoefficiens]
MSDDYNLYRGTPPHQQHSETSREAATKARRTVGKSHQRILSWLGEHPEGGSDERIAAALNMNQNTYRPRRCELQQMGYVTDSGRMELTRSGSNAVVWVRVSSPFSAGVK